MLIQSSDANGTAGTVTSGWIPASSSGSQSVTESITTQFTMTVSGAGGQTQCQTIVTVAPPPAPTCTLKANPTSLPYGGGLTTLSWTTTGATSASIDNGVGSVTPVNSGAKLIFAVTTTNYTLTAKGPGGETTCAAAVTVAPPPPPPAPTCTLSASPTAIQTGGSSTLSWTTTNASAFSINQGIGSLAPVAAGSTSVSPTATITYTGTATGPGGTVHCAATVTVTSTPPPPAAPTCTLSASPAAIQTSGSSTLSWTTTNATSFSIDQSIGPVIPVASGSKSVSPPTTTTYTGTATGPGGTVHCAATVTVTSTPPPPSAPTCTLSASPTSVSTGDYTTLTWTTTHADTFTIDHGIGSVSPAVGGSIHSGAITADTTFTGTVVSPSGDTATCSAVVSVNGGGGGGGGPTCSLTVSPTSYTTGGSATLSWGGSGISNVDISNGVATATSSPGSAVVAPATVGSYTYTGTFHAQTGQTLTCTATLVVTGGSGGCTGNCGGGGGPPPPVITLSALPHALTQPLAYLYLSQIPYTGLDLGPVGTTLYWFALVAWSLALAYLILFGAVPFAYGRARRFGEKISATLNTVQKPADTVTPVAIAPPRPETPQASRGYSAYEGFKSFAHNGALSIEDIVKGLSHQTHAPVVDRAVKTQNVEPIYENVEPIGERVETVAKESAPEAGAAPQVRGFVLALVEGDRTAVFAGLREYVRGGGKPERLLFDAVCLLDDVYRARIDGTACDAGISRLTARLTTPHLEQLVAALATAIDSSYSAGITGAKLALARALAALGA